MPNLDFMKQLLLAPGDAQNVLRRYPSVFGMNAGQAKAFANRLPQGEQLLPGEGANTLLGNMIDEGRFNSPTTKSGLGWMQAIRENLDPERRDAVLRWVADPATTYEQVRRRPQGTRRLVAIGSSKQGEPQFVVKVPVRPPGLLENIAEREIIESGRHGNAVPALYDAKPLDPEFQMWPDSEMLVEEYLPGGDVAARAARSLRGQLQAGGRERVRSGLQSLGIDLGTGPMPQYFGDTLRASSWGERGGLPVLRDLGAISPYRDNELQYFAGPDDWQLWRDNTINTFGVAPETIFNKAAGGRVP